MVVVGHCGAQLLRDQGVVGSIIAATSTFFTRTGFLICFLLDRSWKEPIVAKINLVFLMLLLLMLQLEIRLLDNESLELSIWWKPKINQSINQILTHFFQIIPNQNQLQSKTQLQQIKTSRRTKNFNFRLRKLLKKTLFSEKVPKIASKIWKI